MIKQDKALLLVNTIFHEKQVLEKKNFQEPTFTHLIHTNIF